MDGTRAKGTYSLNSTVMTSASLPLLRGICLWNVWAPTSCRPLNGADLCFLGADGAAATAAGLRFLLRLFVGPLDWRVGRFARVAAGTFAIAGDAVAILVAADLRCFRALRVGVGLAGFDVEALPPTAGLRLLTLRLDLVETETETDLGFLGAGGLFGDGEEVEPVAFVVGCEGLAGDRRLRTEALRTGFLVEPVVAVD